MHRKHLILMIVGCALPIIAVAAIFLFQLQLSSPLLFALVLLCPLSHLLLMGGHSHAEHQVPDKEADHG